MYKELFGVPYAFRKYDQIFVPEYNSNAMENVGAVTWKEDRLKIGQNITIQER
jgi:aminopeptidase N